jgi:hypothetical protein
MYKSDYLVDYAMRREAIRNSPGTQMACVRAIWQVHISLVISVDGPGAVHKSCVRLGYPVDYAMRRETIRNRHFIVQELK